MTTTRAVFLIISLAIIIYSNSLGGEFAWDDEYFVVKNIHIRSIENFPAFFTNPQTIAFGELAKDVYRPLTAFSYSLNYFFSKLNTFGYHLTNVLFHSANGVLVFSLVMLLTGSIYVAFLSAVFFVSHPVQTEVVSWISGLSSVQFLFFYLISLITYVKYRDSKNSLFFALSVISFAFSIFSKEMAITLPVLIILFDIYFPKESSVRKKIAGYIPYFAIAAFYLMMRSFLLKRVSQCAWWGDSPYSTFLTMSKVIVDYIQLLFYPVKLCAFYFLQPSKSIAEPGVILSIAVLALIIAGIFLMFKRAKMLSFAMAWFFITILPVSNIVPLKALMAERFLYLPAIGFCLAAAVLINMIFEKAPLLKSHLRKAGIVIAALIVIFYSARTIIRNEEWKDAVTISRSIIKVSPLNPWGLTSLGAAQMGKGNLEEAEKTLRKAVSISRDYASAHNALGFCYLEMERYEEAIGELEKASRLDPENVETHNSLGVAFASLKKYDAAEKEFRAAVKKDGNFVSGYLNIGALYEAKKEYDKALGEYEKILTSTKYKPDIAIAYIRIGDVYSKTQDRDAAKKYYEKALFVCGNSLPEIKKVVLDRLSGSSLPSQQELKK